MGKEMLLTVNDDLELNKIAESGQCFRWESVGENEWRVINAENCLYISESSEGCFALDCDEAAFESAWREYFDLDTDYCGLRRMIDPDDGFLLAAAERGRGIRILRQDPWEMAVTFIISQNRNIPAIKRSVALLCRLAGTKRRDSRGAAYYTFPGPDAVLSMDPGDLAACRLGYRDKYVTAAAKAAVEGVFSPERLQALPDDALLRELGELYGVGPKVASCIALYGFHRLDAFPVDTWIRRALENEYPGGFPYERYRPWNGVFQQYIFEYYRSARTRKT